MPGFMPESLARTAEELFVTGTHLTLLPASAKVARPIFTPIAELVFDGHDALTAYP